MALNLYQLAAKFEPHTAAASSGYGFRAVCPCHDDNDPSLNINQGDNGGWVMRCVVCNAGAEKVIASGRYPNLSMADLMPAERNGHNGKPKGDWNQWCIDNWGEFVASYDYTDENGKLIKQVVRAVKDGKKQFPQRRRDETGKWRYKCAGLRVVVYRLHILAKADPSTTVFLVEGEKDVRTLEDWGFLATCNDQGAEKFTKQHAEHLRGRRVVILPDNDDAGRRHLAQCQRLLRGVAASVQVLNLPDLPEKGDVTDWRDQGGTKELFLELLASLSDDEGNEPENQSQPANGFDEGLQPALAAESDGAKCLADGLDLLRKGKQAEKKILTDVFERLKKIISERVDKAPSLADLTTEFPNELPPRIHGVLREQETGNLIASPKVGKSWLTCGLALTAATGGYWLEKFKVEPCNVLIVDNELHPATVQSRLHKVARKMGLLPAAYEGKIFPHCLRGDIQDVRELAPFFAQYRPGDVGLIIIDSLYRALPEDVDENSNGQMARIYNLVDKYARQTGASIVMVHHASKGSQSSKGVTDVGSGAGAQSRAPDLHMVLRQHERDGAFSVDCVVRTFEPVPSFVVETEFPLFVVNNDLRADDLKRPKKDNAKTEKKNWTPEDYAQAFATNVPQSKASITSAAENANISARKAEQLFRACESVGLLHAWRTDPTDKRKLKYATVPPPEEVAA